MASINFYLKNTDVKSTSKTAINLIFNYDGNRLKMGTGLSILPKFWNSKTQRARETQEAKEFEIINKKLDLLEERLEKIYNKYIEKGILPEPEVLKHELINDDNILIRPKNKEDFWGYFDVFVEEKRKIVAKGDVRDYDKSLRKHLKKIEEKNKTPLYFDLFKNSPGNIVEKLDYYLEFEAVNAEGDYGLKVNTIGKIHKTIKAFLNWCFNNDITTRFDLKHLPTIVEEQENIYLTEVELERIQQLELEGDEDVIRDLFLIGCETAMRYSDFTRLTNDNIKQGEMICYRPKKTTKDYNGRKGEIYIPFSDRVEDILKKNNHSFPELRPIGISDFNSTLREICKKAEINSPFIKEYKVGGKMIRKEYLKYECVTSHTARRTFCSLKYLANWDTNIIMNFSGHTSEKNFKTYVKLDALEKALKVKNLFRKK